MPQSRFILVVFFLLPILLFFRSTLWADVVGVAGLGVSNTDGVISIGFNLVIQDESAVLKALNDGGEYAVVCTGKLYNRRAGIWNEFLAEASYVCTLSGNPIAREFRVQDSRGERIFEFSDLAHSLDLFWSGLSLSMGSWDLIERNKVYKIMIKFKVSRTNVSDWISKRLFFVGWDLVPELTYEFEFDY